MSMIVVRRVGQAEIRTAYLHPFKNCTWCFKMRQQARGREWERPLLVVDWHSKGQVPHVHVVEQLRDEGGLVVDVRLHAQAKM